MKNNNWIWMAVFFVLCAVTIAGVVFGVTRHDEPGLIPGVRPAWADGAPIVVCVARYGDARMDPTLEVSRHASGVIDAVNARLEMPVLRIAYNEVCPILIRYEVPAEPSWLHRESGDLDFMEPGGAALLGDGYCQINLSNVTGEMRSLVLMHELGHCLGLAHDDQNTSIMRRVQTPTPEGQYPPRFSDSDVALLRERITQVQEERALAQRLLDSSY